MRPTTREPKRVISPVESSQPRGTSRKPFITPPLSPDRPQFRIRRKQHRGEYGEESKDTHESDHNSLVDGAAHAGRSARGGHSLVATDDSDDRPEHRAHEHRPPDIGDQRVVEQRGEEAAKWLPVE